MKIAILHEMFVKRWWAEKVVSALCDMYPDADVFTMMYDEEKMWEDFPKTKIQRQVFTLPTQKIYKLTKNQRLCLLFMPRSVEKLDFSEYDLVIASSSGFAHGAIMWEKTKFIVYSHSPTRYMWDWTNEYKKDIGWDTWVKWLILWKVFLHLRQWDFYASSRANLVLANSKNTQGRIKKYHRRDSQVLYPPVETDRFAAPPACDYSLPPQLRGTEGEYYIIISALTEFKKIEVAVSWFNKLPDNNLLIIGAGDYKEALEKQSNENIIFAWAKYGDELVALVQNSSGLIFPWEEDFWIVPIEVMAAWKPVFALRKWWLTETVIAWKTWAFFDDADGSDFVEKFQLFHKQNTDWFYKSQACKKQAEKFSTQVFEKQLKQYIAYLCN